MFRLYDYTNLIRLFGTAFITPPRRPGGGTGGGGGNTGGDDDSVERDVIRLDVVQECGDGIAVGEIEYPLARGARCEARQFSLVSRCSDDCCPGVVEGGAQALPNPARRANDQDGGVGE
jgi:hypothetical protein